MKILLTVILCSMFFTGSFAQKAILQTDVQEMNLKAKVKSVRNTVYSTIEKDGKIVKDKMDDVYLIKYDKDGNQIENIVYDLNGNIKYATETKYSKPGLRTQHLFKNEKNETTTKWVYEYDVNDYLVKETAYNSSGNIDEQNNYTYTFSDKLHYTRKTINKDGRATGEDRYTLNNDNTIQSDDFLSDGKVLNGTYTYNDKKQKTSATLGKSIKNWEYDKEGNLISYNDSKNFNYTIEYTYDSKNNWVKSITHYSTRVSITERVIEYY